MGKSIGKGYARIGNTLYKEVKNQAKATVEGDIAIGKAIYRLQKNVLRGYVAVGGEIFENGMLVGKTAGKGLIYIGKAEYQAVKGTARAVGAGYIKIGNTVYKPVGKALAAVPTSSTGSRVRIHAKPDLKIDSIYLDRNCNVIVRVKNAGKGKLPNSVWTDKNPKSAGVYLYINGKKWGGATIWKFDPRRRLQKPGGTATYKSNLKINGKANIKAVIDMWNQVAESQEGNNAKIKTLACLKAAGKISAEAIIAEKSPTMTKTLPEGAIGISGQAQIKTGIPEIPVKPNQLNPREPVEQQQKY